MNMSKQGNGHVCTRGNGVWKEGRAVGRCNKANSATRTCLIGVMRVCRGWNKNGVENALEFKGVTKEIQRHTQNLRNYSPQEKSCVYKSPI